MNDMFGRTTSVLMRLALFGIGFFVVLIFSIKIMNWSGIHRGNLLIVGDYEYILYLLAFTLGIGYITRWLLKKEFHQQFVVRKRRRKR
ncbi:hypothetical protein KKE06_04105 [Candidatus Micrarchaeota archaeon]|nr:hypothetical protein [Candidatus Micrarchaeota archaeon]MBU1930689.1 hypothetical protein [Candidatus Micrarchaeota archaeon]